MTGGRLKRVAALRRRRGRFCFTYGDGVADVDIARADRVPPRSTASWRRSPRCSRPAASARSSIDGDARHAASARSRAGDGGWINGGFFVLVAAVLDYIDGDATVWEQRAAASAWPRDGQLVAYRARRLLAADGHAARQAASSRSCGSRASAVEDAGTERPAFWRGQRVLVTGHTGFKGGWLASGCTQLGAEVTGFALDAADRPEPVRAARSRRAAARIEVADVRDATPSRAPDRRRPARGRLPPGRAAAGAPLLRDPVETYATNVMGTVHVLEACRHDGRRAAVVIVTTDKCYENREWTCGLPRGRADGRPRPVLEQQGRAPSWSRAPIGAPSSRTDPRIASVARRQRDRRRRLGARPAGARHRARVLGAASRCRSATPTRSGPGSTCSNRSGGYLAHRRAPARGGRAGRDGLELRPIRRRHPAGQLGRRADAGESGAAANGQARRRAAARGDLLGSIAPRRAPSSAGGRGFGSRTRSTRSSNGTRGGKRRRCAGDQPRPDR